ncbi:MAG: autotransporter outer membrane beta-barrel domain-containing protein [Duodenibacillus sp.]|nr:autotransporter outer membrane beta-barrel domain-containing protein [Duodenibacillus sp.]
MNKVFKKVFKAARGMMMVVNETTSSVQTGKKAAVAVAVMGALAAGTAVAAETVVEYQTTVITEDTVVAPGEYVGAADTIYHNTNGTEGAAIGYAVKKDVIASVTIADSTFKNWTVHNTGSYGVVYGAAVSVHGASSVSMTNVTIEDNAALATWKTSGVQGVGYRQQGGEFYAKNLTIKGNVADGDTMGGGISLLDISKGSIENLTVSNNAIVNNIRETVPNFGVAVGAGLSAAYRPVNLTITNATFENNTIDSVYAYGGGIYIESYTPTPAGATTMTFDTLSVKGNRAEGSGLGVGGGMAIFQEETQVTIKNAVFEGNMANDYGGGIYNSGNLTFSGTNTFTDNTADIGNDLYNEGTITIQDGKTTFNSGIESDGVLNVAAGATLSVAGKTIITALTGEAGATLELGSTADVVVNNAIDGLNLVGAGELNDTTGGDVQAVVDAVKNTDKGSFKSVGMAEGEVMGAVTATVETDANGEVVVAGKTVAANEKTESLSDQVTLAPQMITRIMMNDVRKRMGDLRASEGTHGVWARYNGGEMSGSGMKADFNMIQVGIDTVPVADAPRFGVAFSYAQTDAEGDAGLAKTEIDSYSLAVYGTKMYDNGLFVDVIGRLATTESEITVLRNQAAMNNLALSASGELGWRFDVTKSFFVEPSVEATYTYTNGSTFTMGRGNYELEAAESLVGRAGVAAGLTCPNNKGEVYVRAAVVHEFMGDTTMNSRIGNFSAAPIVTDGKDTWFEYAIGAQYNVNKNTYVYADVERTGGAALDEDWRANVGVRYSF